MISRDDWTWLAKVKKYGIVVDGGRQRAILIKLFEAVNGSPLEANFVEAPRSDEAVVTNEAPR